MNNEKPRKLSLGEIIRRMNEGAVSDSARTVHPGSVIPRTPAPMASPAPTQGAQSPDPASQLPAQPEFGVFGKSQPKKVSPPIPLKRDITEANAEAARFEPSANPPLPSLETSVAPAPTSPEPARVRSTARQTQPAPETGAVGQDNEDEEFDVFRYINVLARRRTVIIVMVILAAVYSFSSYLRSTKNYTAHARLLFSPADREIVNNSDEWRYWTERDKIFNTHLDMIHSDIVLERVAAIVGSGLTGASIASGLTAKQGQSGEDVTNIIEMLYRNPNADLARDVVNEVCRTYIEYHREVKSQENTRFIFQLETQIGKLQSELDKKEDNLRTFKENNRMVQLSDESNLVVTKLSNMELALQQTNLDLLETNKRLESHKTQIGQQAANVVQSITVDNAYQNKLADLELQLSTLLAEYSPEHFKVKMVKQEIQKLKEDMKNAVESKAATQTTLVNNPIRQALLQGFVQLTIERGALETKRTAQEKIIETLNDELLRLPSLEQRFAFLQRETESQLQTLRMLKDKLEEAKIIRDSQESDLKILELAKKPAISVSTVKFSTVLIGILVGLILGIALAFLLEYLDQSIKDPSEAEKLLELPLLGIVPFIETEQALLDDSQDALKTIIEPFRAVRANLNHLMAQHHIRTLMICSAVKGEGKTTLAANLAITFAMENRRVILVDCDLRRSQIHKLFGIDRATGVSDFLEARTDDVVALLRPTKYENLRVMPCGEHPKNPSELVGTVRFQQLVSELCGHADIVLFDSPALLPVSDIITMAPKMDASNMVVRMLWTPGKAACKARDQLKRIGCFMLGTILNGVSHSRGYYPYYYGYYSYKYSYDYGNEPRRFSLREMGNRIEGGVKEGVQNLRLYLPHMVALGMRFFSYCLRRPFFWLLLTILIGATLFEASLRPRKNGGEIPGIQLIALDSSGAAVPRQPSGKGTSLDAIATRAPGADSTLPTADSSATAAGLSDSIGRWGAAFNGGNLEGYFRFYDTLQFVFPGGSFAGWRRSMSGILLSAAQKRGILTIDSVVVDSLRFPYCMTSIYAAAITGPDMARSHIEMVWRSHNGMWRIIRQKSREY